MNIVVLGAGRVGSSVAELLCQREHSVTVVDTDPDRVNAINEELDVRAIVGSGSQSSVLFQAGINSADICLAITGKDEVNIVAASLAKSMGARRSIARVYAPVFRDLSTFDYQRHFGIDRMLSIEHLTAMELARNIRQSGSVVVEQFAHRGLEVQELIVGQEGKVTRNEIKDLGIASNVRLGTIQRGNRMWIASATDQLEVGDKVTVFSRPENLKAVKTLFKADHPSHKRVVIAGGGETGLHLARTLEREGFRITILEADMDRCHYLANLLETTSVVNVKPSHGDTFEEQRVGTADDFVACTGDDEDNMMMGVKANDLGAKQILAVIGRPDYAGVAGRLGIDFAVSERDVMARQILAYLNEGVVISRAKMPGGLINVLEVDVLDGAPATQKVLAEIGLPDRCLIVALIQQDYVRVPGATDRIHAGDIAVLLVEDDVVGDALDLFSKVEKKS
jgi:trk system potassium uptake protein TrkA